MKKIIRNASIVAGISFFSALIASPEPSFRTLYSAVLGFGLTFLLEMQHQLRKPKTKSVKVINNATFFF